MGDEDATQDALRIAGTLIDAGIPVFAAAPCPAATGGTCSRPGHASGGEEYDLPVKWQLTVPSRVWLERWRPGWALAMVGGHRADALDEDPRNGGEASVQALVSAGAWPRVFGVAQTPSGGLHHLVSPLGERKGILLPGLDYQGGAPDGAGRGFIWIAPTVKRSKAAETLGERRPYAWLQPPDLDYLAEFQSATGVSDDSGEGIKLRLQAARERGGAAVEHDAREAREFTEQEAREFCNITLNRLMKAEIGQIETYANDAACQLSHFVPGVWSEDTAYAVLSAALAETAYDPAGPSKWTADKFRAVLAGQDGRAPQDWKAVRRPDVADLDAAVASARDEDVEALLAEMISPATAAGREPPKPLIKTLLNLDSESWVIGEPGSKKSFVVLDMVGHVARGIPWQGLKVTQARVVMIVAEGSGGLGSRIKAWEAEYGPMGDDVHILPRPVQAKDVRAWAVLASACQRIGPGLVVLDTQARVTVGLEENSATDMGHYVEAVRVVREATGACVLSVHHTGRKGGDARGSSAIDGAQHTELKIMPDATNPLAGQLRVEKQKDIEAIPPMRLLFASRVVGQDSDGDDITSLVVVADSWKVAELDAALVAMGAGGDAPFELTEPGEWSTAYVPKHNTLKRRILQAMLQVGKEIGRTEAQYKDVVKERWYQKPKYLASRDWGEAWTSVLAASGVVDGIPDTRVVTNEGGRFRLVILDV